MNSQYLYTNLCAFCVSATTVSQIIFFMTNGLLWTNKFMAIDHKVF